MPSGFAGSASLRVASSLALALLAGCRAPQPAAAPAGAPSSASSTIALVGDEIWISSPDEEALIAYSAGGLVELRRVSVAGRPEGVAPLGDGLIAALAQSTEVALVSAAGAVTRLAVPCGGTRGVATSGDRALVTCPNDDRVVEIRGGAVRRVIAAPGRPTAIAIADGAVAVTASRTGHVRATTLSALDALPEAADPWLEPIEIDWDQEIPLSPGGGFAAIQVDALAVSPGGQIAAAWQAVDHDSDRDRDPARGGYGSVFDGEPRIAPRLLSPCGDRYARFDGSSRVASGPSAMAWAGGLLWVAHRYTDNVLVLGCGAEGRDDRLAGEPGELMTLASFRVGRGPRGIVASADGRTAWVDVGFDHQVTELSLPETPAGQGQRGAHTRQRERVLVDVSDEALRGRSLFHDAVDTHLTPSGIVACATCHPGGGEDGLVWFLHTAEIPRKLRRTPAAWSAELPMHWDGEFERADELVHATITGLMEGDGLMVDAAAVGAWMAEVEPPPGRPLRVDDAALAEAGAELFAERCASCHAGPVYTDGLPHPAAASDDPDAQMNQAITPSLRGVRARPPYLHDGGAPTMAAAIEAHADGLTEEELSAVVRFLETL